MPFVITKPCVGVKDGACVEVCPVDCIHTNEESNQYFIDPDTCINCGLCVEECPVSAIFDEEDVPYEWNNYIQINADYFEST